MMNRIFISYKRIDKDKVFKIKDQIESALGEKCWIDLDGIESDAQFMNVIVKAINDCEVILFMYSKVHVQIADFEKDWTVRELNFASKKNKRIVFVNIDGCPLTDEFEFLYGTKQQIDGRNRAQINKLCIDLKSWLLLKDPTNSEEIDNNNANHSVKDVVVRTFYVLKCKLKFNKKTLLALFAIIAVFGVGLLISKQSFNPKDDYLTSDTLTIDGVKLVMQPILRTDGAESFYISQTEVTQALWTVVMGNNPSDEIGDNLPVHSVSWYDCIEFCLKLSEKTGLSFNLPTKEQWMYAALAGDTLKYCGSDSIDEVAWYTDNSHYKKRDVALKKPNAWGLYDMSGNVCEWCLDSLPQSSLMRVLMGGGHTSSSFENEIIHVDYDYVIHYQDQSHWDNGLRIVMRSKLSVSPDTIHIQSLKRILAMKSIDENRYNRLPHGEKYGHGWVDLGLQSGVKWATNNIGSEDPSLYGDYFAWGETKNCNNREFDDEFRWRELKYYEAGDAHDDNNPLRFSKYVLDSKHGKVDGKSELELSDDAAHVIWGNGWRIPSIMQIEELYNSCTWIWSTLLGHHGYKVIGPNGNSIFLPAAGMRCGGWYDDFRGKEGWYWSRSIYSKGDEIGTGAHALKFWLTDHETQNRGKEKRFEVSSYRYFALRIRPVIEY